jgi:alpha-mannosidase II
MALDKNRLRGQKYSCPWQVPPKEITKSNVHERASTLLQQYRQKSKLYRSKNVLIPLGDDFRYDSTKEIDAQFRNYKMLMDYVNTQPGFKAQMRFGTVRVFRQKFTLEVAIGSHACSLEVNMRVTNGIPLGCSLLLPADTVNCVQTLKAH